MEEERDTKKRPKEKVATMAESKVASVSTEMDLV